jgi:hypothetical protein
MERNIIIDETHADLVGSVLGLETPVWWDQRLFRRTSCPAPAAATVCGRRSRRLAPGHLGKQVIAAYASV